MQKTSIRTFGRVCSVEPWIVGLRFTYIPNARVYQDSGISISTFMVCLVGLLRSVFASKKLKAKCKTSVRCILESAFGFCFFNWDFNNEIFHSCFKRDKENR